jgi:predicted RND superfamily exporter protein/lauroyl/myristoyl acyltransferase
VTSPLPAILSWSRRHRGTVVLAMLALVAAAVVSTRGLRFDTNVLSLLPRTGTIVPAFRTFVESFGSVDDLYVVLTAPPGHGIRDYDDVVETWAQKLRQTPGITRVDTGLADGARDLTWLADRRLLLLSGDNLTKALDRFDGTPLQDALRQRRSLLTLPSPAIVQMVRYDPLALFDLVRDELGASQAGVNLGVTDGGYVSADSQSRLLIAKPAQAPFDADFSRQLMASLDAIRVEGDAERPPLIAQFAGGHRIAVETESVIRRESIMNTIGSLALILPLLYFVFRSPWLVFVGSIPSAVSLVIVLGVLGALGATLSAAATASSAMLFGLGVDGVVLLYVAYTHAIRGGADPAAAIDGLGGPSASMLLGMWTTAATFYGLLLVDFPSLEQLGALIGHSMLVCGVLTLILVPALLPRRRPARPPRALAMPGFASWVQRHARSILIAAGALTIVMALAATRLHINPTLERLRAVTPGAVQLQQIGRTFGLPDEVFVVITSGDDLEQLLASNERLRAQLSSASPKMVVQAPSSLLPSVDVQQRRQDLIRHRLGSVDAIGATLAKAETSEGFREDSFRPFRDRLTSILDSNLRLTYNDYKTHGLDDLIGRFVGRADGKWVLATYAFPQRPEDVAVLERVVATVDSSAVLTGLARVNGELAARFMPELLKGLSIGTAVVILLVLLAFRDVRLSLLSMVPTIVGLVWAAGALAIAGATLDLFALFAVVTFVGIGVDYGVHMVHRYQERRDAPHAVSELAPVILTAALITLLGYGTLITSSYPPLRSIGLVSAVSVATLALASVFVLPAILSSLAPPAAALPAPGDSIAAPRKWTLHGLNNGVIFSLTCYLARTLPRSVSYALGDTFMWIAWRSLTQTRAAIADNLAPLFPNEDQTMLERRALATLRSYARDVVDFLRALDRQRHDPHKAFEMIEEHPQLIAGLRARENGAILITGHYGNWEAGSILITDVLGLPLTIVAMAEADAEVNRIRNAIREEIGAETIEVRQSLDTALQIRRHLAANRIVAMLVDRHYGKDRVGVTLFGRQAWFLRAPFLLAMATGAPLLPCAVERAGPGRFRAYLSEPIVVSKDLPRDEALARAAQQAADAIEARVRQNPQYWYHFYRYWDAQRDEYDGLT